MRATIRVWLLCVVALPMGCAGLAALAPPPTVGRTEAPSPGLGYVGAVFTADEGNDRAVYLLRDGKGGEHLLPVCDIPRKGFLAESRTTLIAVPPGEYRVESFLPITTAKKGAIFGGGAFLQPFTVTEGQVVILGYLYPRIGGQDREWKTVTTTWWLGPEPYRAHLARAKLAEAFPGFSAAPFACLHCTGVGERD